ncbi:methyltransferase domain-containing protein [Nocardia sp. ET3-3]|uniref:Methyltransferase domain-containing protein n=1 Tax=Nocardia terrae TaxID=2675851 RepID=A0A7K1VB35_9NOCA|nr:class I SAM-dependent methyltransferase [Nocardia terrae]MVU83845.1 methyltransferase domain-containing protein [Nocardia terrae]
MTYEHPLAYVLGLEGVALLRAFAGEHDRDFIEARFREIRQLLDGELATHPGVDVSTAESPEGYGIWAETYDGPNPAFGFVDTFIRPIAEQLPSGIALDAACGTGRITALLADCGHKPIGVDATPEMLEQARNRLPDTDFRVGPLENLPIATASIDIVTCALALSHVPDLTQVFTEFARVLRPGGHAIIADIHPDRVARTHVPTVRLPDGTPARIRSHHHPTGDYVRAALAAGLSIRACKEPIPPQRLTSTALPPTTDPGPWEIWPWSLYSLIPEAASSADVGAPSLLLWHFQRD